MNDESGAGSKLAQYVAGLEAAGAEEVRRRIQLVPSKPQPSMRDYDTIDAEPNTEAWENWVNGGEIEGPGG